MIDIYIQDKVMIALELASQNVRGGWATIPNVKVFASEAGTPASTINQRSLDALVSEGRAVRRYPVSNMNRLYRPVRGGMAYGVDSSDVLDTKPPRDQKPLEPEPKKRGSRLKGEEGKSEGSPDILLLPVIPIPAPPPVTAAMGGLVRGVIKGVM